MAGLAFAEVPVDDSRLRGGRQALSDDLHGGPLEIWPDKRQIHIGGRPVEIGARAFDLLVALAERRQRVVSKEELLNAVWPGAEIEENNLAVQISALRKLLGPTSILTLPGHGYRLHRPATLVGGLPPWTLPSPTRPSVAVLPFDTHHAEDAYFGAGMTEDIITALSANHGLFVIARNSTLRYRGSTSRPDQIAAELGVRYLVFGSVRRTQQKLRIGAELVEASSGQILWADHFEGVGDDLFDFQARIASRIAPLIDARVEQLEIAAAAMRPPRDLSAYDCLLRGLATLHSFADGGFEDAGDLLRQAIELDPGYSRAHAHLAWWHALKAGEGRGPESIEDGRMALQLSRRAIELDPSDALALSVAGHAEACVGGNFDAAMALFDQALSIHPGCTVAWGRSAAVFAYSGDGDEALRRADVAMRLSPFDPLGFTFCTTSGTACLVLGRDDEAVTWLTRARWLNPGYRTAWRLLIAALALAGKGDEARAQVTQFMQAEPTFSVSAFAARFPLRQPHVSRILDGMRSVGVPD
jgi:TolB-like protein/Tfp pilus assembly protein PilF